jgi:uncharacterized protein (UPF0333 family)
MRAQVSLELFFAISLFLLVLFWLNHFMGSAVESTQALHTRLLLSSVESFSDAADAACLLSANVSIPVPCVGPNGALLSVFGKTIGLNAVNTSSSCVFEPAAFPVYCEQVVCVQSGKMGTFLMLGACGGV